MTDSWLDNFTDYLASGGIGTVNTDVFQHEFPTDTTEGICVKNTGGLINNKPGIPRRPRVQILVRYLSSRTCFTKSQAVLDKLNAKGNITQSGDRFLYFRALGEPMQINRTQLKLNQFVTNYEIHVI